MLSRSSIAKIFASESTHLIMKVAEARLYEVIADAAERHSKAFADEQEASSTMYKGGIV